MELSLLILAGALSAILTFFLHDRLRQGIVRASAIVGVAAGICTLIWPHLWSSYLSQNFALVCFGATFVGMVQAGVMKNYFLIGTGGVIFTVLFLNASSFVDDFGGGLGAPACIALLIVLSIPVLLRKKKLDGRANEKY